jgi:outer membrane protein assembly factor BamB
LITAVDVANGHVRWQVDHTDPGFGPLYLGLPSLVNGEIWTPWNFARYGGIVAHDPKTGAFTMLSGNITLGHIVTHHGRFASLFGAAIPGTVLLALQYGGVHAGLIDVTSGGLASFSDPVFAGNRHVWVGYGSSVLRFDPSGDCVAAPVPISYCMPNRAAPLGGDVVGLAAGIDHTLVATTDNGVTEVLDDVTGAELWRATPGSQLATPAVSAGVIAVGGSDGQVHAYDASGCGASVCAASWSGDAGASIATAPAFGAGLVFVGTSDGHVVAFTATGCGSPTCDPTATGRVLTPSAITGGPVFGAGTIAVGTADGHLVGFRAP